MKQQHYFFPSSWPVILPASSSVPYPPPQKALPPTGSRPCSSPQTNSSWCRCAHRVRIWLRIWLRVRLPLVVSSSPPPPPCIRPIIATAEPDFLPVATTRECSTVHQVVQGSSQSVSHGGRDPRIPTKVPPDLTQVVDHPQGEAPP